MKAFELPIWRTQLVYGPVDSRRLGKSLGLNVLGAEKICSFDCVYCDLGRTTLRLNQLKKDIQLPSVEDFEHALRSKLRDLTKESARVDYLTFSGNGEPTLNPALPECIEVLLRLKEEFGLKSKTAIMTNAFHFESRKMANAVNLLDERMVKVDAGNEQCMKMVNAPLVRATTDKLTSATRQLKDCVVQGMFIQGSVDNTKPEMIEEWIELVGIIKPKLVHIVGLNRPTAQDGLLKVSEDGLYTIASKLKRRTGIESLVFP